MTAFQQWRMALLMLNLVAKFTGARVCVCLLACWLVGWLACMAACAACPPAAGVAAV
jgi:hypothetical protein